MSSSDLKRAVFLDRDGVINRAITKDGQPSAPFSLDEFEILPGVIDALGALRAAGFLLIVTTNQPEIARGGARREQVETIHQFMRTRLPLDDVLVCYHDDSDKCACRKPRPGMIIRAAVDHEVRLDRSFMVGDRWRDIGAGKNAGCRTILVSPFPESLRIEPDIELPDLVAAARWILTDP
jgi:D-glycero-D-manno-heptose 1,7-bisphosphate phosphatase